MVKYKDSALFQLIIFNKLEIYKKKYTKSNFKFNNIGNKNNKNKVKSRKKAFFNINNKKKNKKLNK